MRAENYKGINGIQKRKQLETPAAIKNVGSIDARHWMDYRVNVARAGTYSISFPRSKSGWRGQRQRRSGSTVIATVAIPMTGNWHGPRNNYPESYGVYGYAEATRRRRRMER